MPHTIGRAFLICASRKCDFWIWADGTLPFSDEAQGRFNEWADSEGIDDGICFEGMILRCNVPAMAMADLWHSQVTWRSIYSPHNARRKYKFVFTTKHTSPCSQVHVPA